MPNVPKCTKKGPKWSGSSDVLSLGPSQRCQKRSFSDNAPKLMKNAPKLMKNAPKLLKKCTQIGEQYIKSRGPSGHRPSRSALLPLSFKPSYPQTSPSNPQSLKGGVYPSLYPSPGTPAGALGPGRYAQMAQSAIQETLQKIHQKSIPKMRAKSFQNLLKKLQKSIPK